MAFSVASETPAANADSNERLQFANLFGAAREALQISPPNYVASIFGHPWTWLPPHRRYSELSVIDLWRPRSTLKTLLDITVPSIPINPPPLVPPVLNSLFVKSTVILQRPDHNGNHTSFPDETWFFLNGVVTNDIIAQRTAAYLAYLFHRPITMIQNATNSILVDLFEAIVGQQGQCMTEPAIKAFPAIYDALKSPHKRKVVVIAHSQGTVIMANVLRWLGAITRGPTQVTPTPTISAPRSLRATPYAEPEIVYPDAMPLDLCDFAPLDIDELAKLELYCFATCATTMRYIRPPLGGAKPAPWLEHYGNDNDIIARMGVLAPNPERWGIDIQGPRYRRPDLFGHLLNEHYLFGIADQQKQGRKRGGRGGTAPFERVNAAEFPHHDQPRLYHYINGGTPPEPK